MTPEAVQIKKIHTGRGLLDIDTNIASALELFASGDQDEAIALLRDTVASLRDRFKDTTSDSSREVAEKRFAALAHLAWMKGKRNLNARSLKAFQEAYAIATEHLGDNPEYGIVIGAEIVALLVRTGDLTAAKQFLTALSKTPGSDSGLCRASIALATAALMSAYGKSDLAVQALKSGAAALAEPSACEQVVVKFELSVLLATIAGDMGSKQISARSLNEAAKLLDEHIASATENGRVYDQLMLMNRAVPFFESLPQNAVFLSHIVKNRLRFANLLAIRGRWEKAQKLFASTIELLGKHEITDPSAVVPCLTGTGEIHINRKDYESAESVTKDAIDKAKSGDYLPGHIEGLYLLGLCKAKSGDNESGLALFEKALDMSELLPDTPRRAITRARIYNQLGYLAMRDQQPEEALRDYGIAKRLLSSAPAHLVLAETHRMLGDFLSETGESETGELELNAALDIAESLGATYEMARIYKSLGDNNSRTGSFDKAVFFFDESTKILERLGIETDLPMIYSSKARICHINEEYGKAEELYTKEFNIVKRKGGKHGLAFSYYHLGMIQRLLDRVNSATEYLNKSLALLREVRNLPMQGTVLLELALCASHRRDIKRATDFCAQASECFSARRQPLDMAKLLSVRAVILRDANRLPAARRDFEDALRTYEKTTGGSVELAETYYEFSILHSNSASVKDATVMLKNAIDIVEKLGITPKLDKYQQALNRINPEAGAKMRLSRLMDKTAVEQISKTGSSDSLIVERKNMTILFTDIRSFTTISETIPLEELSSMLNDFYTNVTQVVIRHGGTVNKFIGDAVLAIFNIDGNLADHPAAAVRAGLDIVRTFNSINLIRARKGEVKIDVGVGINTGEVFIGAFGSGVRQDYTAIGDSVNIASRLQSQAGPGEIVISQYVYDTVKALVETIDLGEKPLKGKGQPLRLYKVTNSR